MKRIGIVSDSHGDAGHIQQALIRLEACGPLDALIHCGDSSRDALPYTGNILQVVAVRGNCDGWLDDHEEEMLVTIGNVPIFVTHGHRYGVKRGLELLSAAASARGARVACFGHTHQPFCEYRDGVLLINPGSCAYTGRCALLTIRDRGDIDAQLM